MFWMGEGYELKYVQIGDYGVCVEDDYYCCEQCGVVVVDVFDDEWKYCDEGVGVEDV